jgi:hypothetical protein
MADDVVYRVYIIIIIIIFIIIISSSYYLLSQLRVQIHLGNSRIARKMCILINL